MKKILIGFVAGALFMVAGQSFADGVTFIGKKVELETPVRVDGQVVDNAIVLEGKSFIPVRSITTAMGGEVVAVGKGGIDLVTTDDVAAKIMRLEKQRSDLIKEIENCDKGIAFNENDIKEFKSMLEKAVTPADKEHYNYMISKAQERIDSNTAKKTELKKKVDALNAEIEALKTQP